MPWQPSFGIIFLSEARPPAVRAAIMMIICCALIAASTFGAKVLGRGEVGAPMHAFQTTFGRYFFALCVLTTAAFFLPVGRPKVSLPLYAARTFCGWAGVSGLFAAAALIQLADATAISFLSPVFAMLLAVMFLGETVGRFRWGAALVALAGGMILLRPGDGALEPGAAIAFGAAVILAIEITLIKRITRVEPVLRFLLITNIMGALMASAAALPVWRPPSLDEWAIMAFVGFSMVSAQILFTASMRIADASFIAPFFYATLIFAALYDAIWFGVIPGSVSITGAALILCGAMVLAWREARQNKPSS